MKKEGLSRDICEGIIQEVYRKVTKPDWPDTLAHLYLLLYQEMEFEDAIQAILDFENVIELRAKNRQHLRKKDILPFSIIVSSAIQKKQISVCL